MKISEREMILGVATLACLLFGGTWYVVDRRMEEWRAQKSEIEKIRQQIGFHENAIKMQENWVGELNELQQDLRVFEDGGRTVSPELMKTIKAFADQYGMEITRSQPYAEKPTGDLFELGINCSWNGSLEAMVDFLADLQRQGVRYDVRTLTVQPVGQNSGQLKGSMVIHCAYTRKPAP